MHEIRPPPPCPSCGAEPMADHAENCNVLAAIRGQEYPIPIDGNGAPWYMNAITKRDQEIEQLRVTMAQQATTRRAALDEAVNVVKFHRAGWATRPIGKGAEKVLDEVMMIERALAALRDAEGVAND